MEVVTEITFPSFVRIFFYFFSLSLFFSIPPTMNAVLRSSSSLAVNPRRSVVARAEQINKSVDKASPKVIESSSTSTSTASS